MFIINLNPLKPVYILYFIGNISSQRFNALQSKDIARICRAIDNNFFSYTVVDTNGVIHTGILASETGTSVTLKQPEGKTVSFGRADIEAMKNNGVSLMPVGLEKTVPPQDMADVISFIKNWRYLDGSVPKEVIR